MKKLKKKSDDEYNFWQPATDMMTGLVFILMLIVALLGMYILTDFTGYENSSSYGAYSYSSSYIDDEPGDGSGWADLVVDDGHGDGDGDGDGDGQYDVIPTTGGGGGGGYGEDGIKSAVFVELVDDETDRIIPEEGVTFELYRTDQTTLQNGSRQTLYTYYPVKISYIDFETTEDGTFYLPEKVWHGNYYFHEITEPKGYDAAADTYFDITEMYDWPDPYVVQIRVLPSKNIIRVQMQDEETEEPITGGTFDVVAAENITTMDGTVRYTKGQVVDTIVCDEEGYGESIELYLGNYTLEQADIPEYYAGMKENLDVEVEKRTAAQPEPEINYVNCVKTQIILNVADELYTSQKLEGASFLVTNERTKTTQTVTTDSTGRITLTDLDKNATYTILQTGTVEDYRMDTLEHSVSVNAKGWINDETWGQVDVTNRLLRVNVRAIDMVLRSDTKSEEVSLYSADDTLINSWATNGAGKTFTGLDEGDYYIVRGENGSKRYEFTVIDTAEVQNWNITIFTWKSALALLGMALAAALVIFLLVRLVGLLLALFRRNKEKKAAAKAAAAQQPDDSDEDNDLLM